MKKLHAFLIAVVVLGIVILWFARKQTPATRDLLKSVTVEGNQEAMSPAAKTGVQQQEGQATIQTKPPMSESDLEAFGRKAIAEQAIRQKDGEEKWKAQWSTPISFYGRVIDEKAVPVAGVSVEFQWTNVEGKGLRSATASDSFGTFALIGIQSRGLNVHVSKEGYYTSKRLNQTSFLYADMTGRGTFTPDSSNPVVFHLRKKGPGTELITSQHGVSPLLEAQIPRDGISVQIDLLDRKVGAQGQLVVSQTKPNYANWKQATQWTFRAEIPDGGFVEYNDEFPFEAPETGYQRLLEFNFQAGQTNWTTSLHKDYYIKFGNPPRYGRLRLESDIMWGGARFTYAINPDGSRNLEPK